MYRLFLGAPSVVEIDVDPSSYSWRTISSHTASSKVTSKVQSTQSLVLPRATLEAASHRISLIYKDVVFEDEDDAMQSFASGDSENEVEISVFRGIGMLMPCYIFLLLILTGIEQSTVISWPPSMERSAQEKDDSRGSLVMPSFLRDTTLTTPEKVKRIDASITTESQFAETQALESQSFGNYFDASSIGRFPSFHFDLHTLSSLSQLSSGKVKGSMRVNVLLAVLEVEGPDTIRIKKGADAGQVVSVLKLILGDDEGNVVKLTAWREVAEDWGGTGTSGGVATKRGDVIYIESKFPRTQLDTPCAHCYIRCHRSH